MSDNSKFPNIVRVCVAGVALVASVAAINYSQLRQKEEREKFGAMLSASKPEVRMLESFVKNKGYVTVADTVDWDIPNPVIMGKLKENAVPILDYPNTRHWLVRHKEIKKMRTALQSIGR